MLMEDQQLKLDDCSAKTLGGNVTMNGAYNTQNPEKPNFDFKYNVSSFDFAETFEKLNSFATLAPIGKFINGSFNTSLDLKGDLGSDMMPDLSTLSASGFLQTIEGVVTDLKPLEEVAKKLNINALKSLN